ncbi:MAG: hypothetical protein ACFFBD_02980 [Candidatus Hodarchaeota archaeon]
MSASASRTAVLSQPGMSLNPSHVVVSTSALGNTLENYELVSEILDSQWLFHLQPEIMFQASEVRDFLKKLQEETYQCYVAFFNPHTRYLLVKLRG